MSATTKVKTYTINGVSFNMITIEKEDGTKVTMQETPVTNALWCAVMGGEMNGEPGHPKVEVSAIEADEFVKKVAELTGDSTFCLPAEKDWEAALGEAPSEDEINDYAWSSANSDWKLHPVAELKPNEYGLFDMRGLVWEWMAPTNG